MAGTEVLATTRLALRRLTLDDCAFIVGLVNEPSWLRFIGNKNVASLDDARRYLENGPFASYRQHGFGLWAVTLQQQPIGMCGLLKRDTLPDVDIGFAFRPEFWGQGYALEAAAATLEHARAVLRLPRVLAITDPENASSIRLLEKLGLAYERRVRATPDGAELLLYAIDLKQGKEAAA